MSRYTLVVGDCRVAMAEMAADSVDAVVTDPPYELGFMSKAWDRRGVAFDPATWAACLRVLKPGGRLLAFGAPRTAHRIWCAIEDAGFSIEDTVMWLFGSGFPKHRSKLKPAYEPICCARKGPVTALNIDECRIEGAVPQVTQGPSRAHTSWDIRSELTLSNPHPSGRWPANVMLDEAAAAALDEQSGELVSGANPTRRGSDKFRGVYQSFAGQRECTPARGLDVGGASRFFYTAKASRSEREHGLEGAPRKPGGSNAKGFADDVANGQDRNRPTANHHPTVKPVELMRYLVRLVTPNGGVVLDPFAGSGTTGVACTLEGRDFIGIELDPDYAAIAERRIANAQPSLFSSAGGEP